MASLSPKGRARILRAETRERKQKELTSAMIDVFVMRSLLNESRPDYQSDEEHWEAVARYRKQLDAAQLRLETLLFKKYRLDHLRGVEAVYGLKQRKTRAIGK